jgi:hypothetical protein
VSGVSEPLGPLSVMGMWEEILFMPRMAQNEGFSENILHLSE